jgi:hypothetical protein
MIMVYLDLLLYGDKAKAAVERDEPLWQEWVGEQFLCPSGADYAP